jgi:hypothetical protein
VFRSPQVGEKGFPEIVVMVFNASFGWSWQSFFHKDTSAVKGRVIDKRFRSGKSSALDVSINPLGYSPSGPVHRPPE